jgi:hypothetical protein
MDCALQSDYQDAILEGLFVWLALSYCCSLVSSEGIL